MNNIGFLQSRKGTPYGIIGTKTSIKDINGKVLYIGDLVNLYIKGEFKDSNRTIIDSKQFGFCVMGMGGYTSSWKVKLSKRYYDVDDWFESAGEIIHHIEQKLQKSKQEYNIYTVEDSPCGNKTKFTSCLDTNKLKMYSMVVCDINEKDNYYGRIIDINSEELTNKKYNKLPSIIGIVN